VFYHPFKCYAHLYVRQLQENPATLSLMMIQMISLMILQALVIQDRPLQLRTSQRMKMSSCRHLSSLLLTRAPVTPHVRGTKHGFSTMDGEAFRDG
jgi:hypothetical protein